MDDRPDNNTQKDEKHLSFINKITTGLGIKKIPSMIEIIIFFGAYFLYKFFDLDLKITLLFWGILIFIHLFRSLKITILRYSFAIIASILTIYFLFILFNSFNLSPKPENEYLIKNRARLNCILSVDKIERDSFYYHLEITNVSDIPASSIHYKMLTDKEMQSENRNIKSELGKNENYDVYPFANFGVPNMLNFCLNLQY